MLTKPFWRCTRSKVAVVTMVILVVGLLTAGAWTNYASLTSKADLSGDVWSQWAYTYYDNFDQTDVDFDKVNAYVKFDSGSGSKYFTLDQIISNENGDVENNGWQGYLSQYQSHYEGNDFSPDPTVSMGGTYRVWSKIYTRFSAATLRHKTTFARYFDGSVNKLVVCRIDTVDWPATHTQENNDCPF